MDRLAVSRGAEGPFSQNKRRIPRTSHAFHGGRPGRAWLRQAERLRDLLQEALRDLKGRWSQSAPAA